MAVDENSELAPDEHAEEPALKALVNNVRIRKQEPEETFEEVSKIPLELSAAPEETSAVPIEKTKISLEKIEVLATPFLLYLFMGVSVCLLLIALFHPGS